MPPRVKGFLLVAALVAAGVWRSHLGTQLDGLTDDEPWHLVAGTSYARTGDYRLNPEHPPLVKLWVGAAASEDFRLRPLVQLREKTQERVYVEQTLYADNDSGRIQARSRIAMWSFHALLLVVLGLMIWHTFGLVWASGTLAFLAIDPTVGAHLPLAMTDLPLALTLLIAAVSAGQLAAGWCWRWVLGCGLSLGVAVGSKHSAIAAVAAMIAVLVVSALLRARQGMSEAVRRLGKLSVVGLIALAFLWGLYGFHFHSGVDGSDAFNRPIAQKISDIDSVAWRFGISSADLLHLVPRAYLWGLADTVRAGVEGRSQNTHFVWGTNYVGRPPLHLWPSVVVSKIPIALTLLALLGLALLWRITLSSAARWTLGVLLCGSLAHLLALVSSRGSYGGIRHALPLVVALAVLGGGAAAEAWRRHSPALLGAVTVLLAAALAMTIGEPRLWDYYNELAGGTANGFRYFTDAYSWQRFPEVQAFYKREIAPTGLPLYDPRRSVLVQAEVRASNINVPDFVEDMNDTNVDGAYDGFFLFRMRSTLPWPLIGWDPEREFKGLKQVATIGPVGIWRGRSEWPRLRALSMCRRVERYIYEENGSDWALVAKRLDEVAAVQPQDVSAGVELGNAYLRLNSREDSIHAYRRLLTQDRLPLAPQIQHLLEAQIARIDAAADLSTITPIHNPTLE